MTTTESKAAEAWRLMTREGSILDTLTGREPLPPWAALDMVQDEAGDRDAAVYAILTAAKDALFWKLPKSIPGVPFMDDAIRLLDNLAVRDLDRAHSSAVVLESAASDTGAAVLAGARPPGVLVMDCEEWRLWAIDAFKAIEWCRRLCEAQ